MVHASHDCLCLASLDPAVLCLSDHGLSDVLVDNLSNITVHNMTMVLRVAERTAFVPIRYLVSQ